MTLYNDKTKIREHYDFVSPYYRALWGEHLHHGYWITGKETKEEAQLALTKYLAEITDIKKGTSVLDVGCGFGASSIYLARTYGTKTKGVTISSVQVTMANEAAREAGVDSEFFLMDAEMMDFHEQFDVIWSIESISHYSDKKKFFENALKLLKPGGTVALIDWFKKEEITENEFKKYIVPIEEGMLVELQTMTDYVGYLQSNGCEITKTDNLNDRTYKTWDISLDIIKNKSFWDLALKNGKELLHFLQSFRAMKAGFSSGNFVYGMIIVKKSDSV